MDLSGSPLGCARRNPPAVACFRGAYYLVKEERICKYVISDGSATATQQRESGGAGRRAGGGAVEETERLVSAGHGRADKARRARGRSSSVGSVRTGRTPTQERFRFFVLVPALKRVQNARAVLTKSLHAKP